MATRRQFVQGSAAVAAFAALGTSRLVARAQDATPAASPVASPVALFDISTLPLKTPGQLTIHADQPLYSPWFIDNDPTNGKGFEGSTAYAIAAALGFTKEQVVWGYTSFNTSYAPGPKDFDFYITEVSITENRKKAVDFSDPYYNTPLVIVAKTGSPVLEARSLTELKPYRFGTQVGTIYHSYIQDTIQPEQDTLVYDTNADSLQALENDTVDVVVETLDIGIYNTTIQFQDLSLGGILPGTTSDLGLVFEKGSELVPYVNQALAAIKESGLLAQLQAEWLPNPPGIFTYTE